MENHVSEMICLSRISFREMLTFSTALAALLFFSALGCGEEFSVTSSWPPPYSRIKTGRVYKFAEGGIGGAAADRIYLGNLGMAKSAYSLNDPSGAVKDTLYGVYKPSGDLIFTSGSDGSLELAAGGNVRLSNGTVFGRLCKWFPDPMNPNGSAGPQCPGPDSGEVWTPVAMGSTAFDGSVVQFLPNTLFGGVLCCRFSAGATVAVGLYDLCVPYDEVRLFACATNGIADGRSGSVTKTMRWNCPGLAGKPVASGVWVPVPGSDTCACALPAPVVTNAACPAGDVAGAIANMASYACSGATAVLGKAAEISNTCMPPPPDPPCVLPSPNPAIRTLSCCSGFDGYTTWSVTYSCVNGTPQESSWQKIGDACYLPWWCSYNGACPYGMACWGACINQPCYRPS